MYVIPNGMIECDLANLIAMPNLANSENKHTISKWVKSPVYSVLIENEDGIVLFDTGCHPDAMCTRWNEENKKRTPLSMNTNEIMVNALENLGYKPKDIDYLVLSHLHEDHAGSLEIFSESKVLVSDRELTQTLRLYALNKDMGGYIRNDIEEWLKSDIHWELVDDDIEEMKLLDGITILNFGPGHAFGMMGLLVELPNEGNIILASDTINTSRNYGPPILYPGLAYDTRGYYKTVKRIHTIADRYNARVFFGHDDEQYQTLKKAPIEWYD